MLTKNSRFLYVFAFIFCAGCTGYVTEADGVYYKNWNEARGSARRLLKDADPNTFEVLNNKEYGRDHKLVFYQGEPIPGADPLTFEFVGGLYAKDRYRAYYGGDSIQASTSKDFKIIDGYYSSDSRDIYYTTYPLQVCSPKKFTLLPLSANSSEAQRWSTDGCFYYFMHLKIPSTDYKNVFLFKDSPGLAKDKHWVYFGSHRINFDEAGNKILDTVDAATFTVTNSLDCKDKFGCINPFHGREACGK